MPVLLPEIISALTFAAEKHQYQRRAGYESLPYINHLLKVLNALIEIGKEKDRDILLAAILHDIIEDTEVTHQHLAERFGQRVADIVLELTDDMSLPYNERKRLQVDRAKQLSPAAKKIRIADKASNMLDIFNYPLEWSIDRKKAYLENSILVVNQIRGTNDALEKWFDETVVFAKNKLNR